jgi:hypothetical protein
VAGIKNKFQGMGFRAFRLLSNSDATFVGTLNGDLRIVPLGYEIPCVGSA